MIIAVDIDGVLANYLESFKNSCRVHGINININNVTNYNLYQYLGIEKKIVDKICDSVDFLNMTANYNAVRTINRLYSDGCKISISTHRDRKYANDTIDWIHKNTIAYDDIVFCSNKYKYDSVSDVLVDDNIDIISNNINVRKCILVAHPYNNTINISGKIIRTDDWGVIYNLLSNYK